MTTPPDDGSDLRRLLGDAVTDVHPHGTPEQIRSRARRPSTDRWVPIVAAAAVATVAVIGGAAWLGRQGDSPPAAAPGTTETSKQDRAAQTPARTVTVPVYYVAETAAGPRLFKETHRVDDTTSSELQVAVEEAVAGQPRDPDYTSAWPYSGMTAKATQGDTEIRIDLVTTAGDGGGTVVPDTERRAVQALVWTADAATSSELPVRVTFNGGPISKLFTSDIPMPVTRASADSVLSPVSISSPAEGATVPRQFQVTGQAAAFEANVVWELRQRDRVVRTGFTTAAECCTLSPYAFTVTASPGDYILSVHDTDESGGEGVGTNEDTKQITVK